MANRKKKKQAMSLSEFHAAVATTEPEQPQATSRINWADEMEALDEDDPQQANFVFDRSKLPTAPKSVRQSELDLENIPKRPPFKAFLGNISFEADETMIRNFFKDLKVVHVHMTVDQGGRSKGSGTVEFEDRDGLIAALNKNESMLNNRAVRITLLEAREGGREGGRGGGYMQRDDGEPLKSDESDWRRPREPEPEVAYPYQNNRDRGGDSKRGGYGGGRGGYDRGGDRGGRYGDRGGDRGGYQQRTDRYGGGGDRYGGGGYGNRQEGGDRGGYGNRHEGGDRNERRQYGGYNRGEQGEQRSEGENAWARSSEPASDEPRREAPRQNAWGGQRSQESSENRQSEPVASAPMTERPKLQLAPRTLPVEEVNAPVGGSSIFGSAKPVNTAAREREIEERLKEERAKQQEAKADTDSQQGDGQRPDKVPSRSHRTSNASEDGNKSQTSITSPQQQQQHQHSGGKPAENPWKSKQAAALFEGQDRGSEPSRGNTYNDAPRSYNSDRRGGDRGGYNKRPDERNNNGRGGYNNNRDGGNRGGHDRRGTGASRGARGGYNSQDGRHDRPYKNYNEPRQQQNDEPNDIGFANKFAGLKVDVDEVE